MLGAGLVFAPAQAATTADSSRCGAILGNGIVLEIVGGLPLVTVLADGVAVTLILDTGAERTVLTSGAAERVGARAPQVQFRRSLKGVAGSLQSREVEFNSFTLGGVDLPWRRVRIASFAMSPILSRVDGVLGADVLSKFDLDLDVPNRRMSLYEKGICTPGWAVPYAEIKIGRSAANDNVFFPVQLDYRKIAATIDTGAQRSTLSATTARAMGFTDAILAHDPPIVTRGFGSGRLDSRIHRFESLTVGDITVSNPQIVVTDLRLRGIDLILGMDFLRSRRLWLSYAGFRVFLSK